MESYPPKHFALENSLAHASWAAGKVRREKSTFWTYKYTSKYAVSKGEVFLEQDPGGTGTLFDPVGECWVIDSLHQVNRDIKSPFGRTSESDSAILLFGDGSLAFASYFEYRAGGDDGQLYSARFLMRHVEALDLLALDFAKDRIDIDDEWESWYWPSSLYRNVPWGESFSGDQQVKYEVGVAQPGDGFLRALRGVALKPNLGSASTPASPSIADQRIAAFDSMVAPLVEESNARLRESKTAYERERAQRALEWERDRPEREKRAKKQAKIDKRKATKNNSRSWWRAKQRAFASFLFVLMWTTVLFDAEFPASGHSLEAGALYANALLHLVFLAAMAGLLTALVSLALGRGSVIVPLASALIVVYEVVWNRYPIWNLSWVDIDLQPTADFFVGKLWEGLTQPLILIFLSLIASRFLIIWIAGTHSSRVR